MGTNLNQSTYGNFQTCWVQKYTLIYLPKLHRVNRPDISYVHYVNSCTSGTNSTRTLSGLTCSSPTLVAAAVSVEKCLYLLLLALDMATATPMMTPRITRMITTIAIFIYT
jgi:hypothetical protein